MFECKAWSEFVINTGFQQLVNQPTRVTKKSSSVIDHIYSNRDDRICEISIPSITLNDHFPVCVTRKFNSRHTKSNSHSVLKYWSFKNFQLTEFQRDLSLSPLNLLETEGKTQIRHYILLMKSAMKFYQDMPHLSTKESRVIIFRNSLMLKSRKLCVNVIDFTS